MVSAFIDSPTSGGASWLAHASLLSGIEIRDNASHAMLLTLSRDTLVHRFRQRGFRAVAVMPGLKQAWPEGSFYGFDRIYGEKALAYAGPAFGWWRIPDQFALARLTQRELTPGARKPVFAFFPTISTHAPFHPVPPYQADWQRMLGDTPFDAGPLETSLSRAPNWTRPGAAYPRALRYALRTLAGWLERGRPPTGQRDLVLVALGDHQPPAAVSGPGAGQEVPVHVFTAGMTSRTRWRSTASTAA